MPINSYDSILDDALSLANDPDVSTMNVFDNFFSPNLEQRAEFGQQVALQQMQNDWSVGGKFDAMKKAGINANVAASGIAGASASSASAPNSAVGAGAQGVASAAQAAGAVNEAVNAGVNAYEKFSLTGIERENRKAQIRERLSNVLHNEWLSYAISEMLPLQKENERADTWLKLANFDKAREEKRLINKRIDEADAHIKELLKHADLLEAQGNYTEALKERTDAETAQIQLQNNKLQWDKDFRERWHFDNTKPVDNALIEAMMFEDGESNGVVDTIGKAVNDLSYNERKGFNAAEIEDVFDKTFNEIKANAAWKPYLSRIEADKQHLIDLVRTQLENPSDIRGFYAKLMNLIGNILGVANLESSSSVAGANPPTK